MELNNPGGGTAPSAGHCLRPREGEREFEGRRSLICLQFFHSSSLKSTSLSDFSFLGNKSSE